MLRTALPGLVALCSAGRLRRGYDSERFQLLVKQTRNDALAQALTAPSFSFSLAVEERTTGNPSSDIVNITYFSDGSNPNRVREVC